MKINEVAKLTGVTVRTLHYYDKINLLKPCQLTQAGYRIYGDKELDKLQQILFFKELDFSLDEIKDIISSLTYNKDEIMRKHKEFLIHKRNRLNNLIILVENIQKGEEKMSFKEFDTTTIEKIKKEYASEAKERYGKTIAYAESIHNTNNLNKQQWEIIDNESQAILKKFEEICHLDPNCIEAQSLVKEWQDYISKNFYNCTTEILSCLGTMYIEDKRFTANIDKHIAGTAKFMSESIAIYCQNK